MSALERAAAGALNRRIAESISAARMAAELAGRSCRVTVEGLSVDVLVRVREGRVVFEDPGRGPADVCVSGTPFDLLRLVGPEPARRVRESPATVSGEIRVAEQFAELLRLAAPDPEEELAGWIGDVAAHGLGDAARRASAWGRAAAGALRDDLAEYLKEEIRALPSPHEAEAFYADVERLRDDVERAAARLARIAGLVRSR